MMNIQNQIITLPDGRQITIETGKLAKQADGSVVVKCGDTMLLATVCAKTQAAENIDYLPLQVEYQEKYAATGRFPGGFFKREARLSEYEILISRLVDRALRPLFPADFHADTQVLVSLISGDTQNLPDVLACVAASAAIMVSDIPFNGPVAEVRVARINGEYVINPMHKDLDNADIDIMAAGTLENIVMVEGEMKEVQESDMLEAMKVAHSAIKLLCQGQLDLAAKVEKAKNKRVYNHENNDESLKNRIFSELRDKVSEISHSNSAKHVRSEAWNLVYEEFLETLPEEELSTLKPMAKRYFDELLYEVVRAMILDDQVRLDGRKTNEIRPIWCETNYLPSVHGSAIFTRGETQSLTTCTLGSKQDQQTIDGVVIEGTNNFILHYNFPPFATGEVKPMRGTARREVGHGNLALRALKPVIPSGEVNPYTIRLVSDILESNGSSSMATVCAGTMALMDAGVKIKKPVSGIAMGLITNSKTGKYAVLSDILGDEDHLGDMDFKVTGTKDGITACQMDIKVDGLSFEILESALNQAKEGRLHILGEILKVISEPRTDYKSFVPRIVKTQIPREFIGAMIGPGGKHIQELQRETGTTISIEEVGEFGVIDVMANSKEAMDTVMNRIKSIVAIVEVGEVYDGKVKTLQPYGAFVEILPGKEGLLHISEVAWSRIEDISTVLKVGDIIKVKLLDVDKKTGKYKLSHKVLIPRPEKDSEQK
ncbi:MAG: polyribonucleotide nucleotidyltransferase [Bacteroidales bacterium]|nr:polyribonucleotide nucleotidyltransferase [Bacteroidales bacterium]